MPATAPLTPQLIYAATRHSSERVEEELAKWRIASAAPDPVAVIAEQLPARLREYGPMHYRSLEKSIKALEADTRLEHRKKDMQCRACAYLGGNRLAGQAFTSRPCQHCEQPITWPNTAVPPYCETCARAHQVCRLCAASIDDILGAA